MAILELAGDDDEEKCRTFVFEDQGHTLGNALRTIITSYPEVEFCGYTVPHPAEKRVHFRIQSKSARAIDLLMRGFSDLEEVCNFTMTKFEKAVAKYSNAQES